MKLLKRITGGVIVVVGAIGVALCVYAVVHTWSTADHMGREVPQAIDELEAAVSSVHRRSNSASLVVRSTRDQLGSIVAMVAELSHSQGSDEFTSVLDRLDVEIVERLERAEEFVRSMQSSVEGASGALMFLESMPFFGPGATPAETGPESTSKNLVSNLDDVSAGLEQVSRILADIRTSRTIDPARVADIQIALQQVDEYLKRIQLGIEDFSAETNSLAVRLADVKSKSGRWIVRAAGFSTLFFVCFGCSQFYLLIRGYTLLTARPSH